MEDFNLLDALSAVFGPLKPVFDGDAYANVSPDDLPPLPDLSDDDGDAMELEFQELEMAELPDSDGPPFADEPDDNDDGTNWDAEAYRAERDFGDSDEF